MVGNGLVKPTERPDFSTIVTCDRETKESKMPKRIPILFSLCAISAAAVGGDGSAVPPREVPLPVENPGSFSMGSDAKINGYGGGFKAGIDKGKGYAAAEVKTPVSAHTVKHKEDGSKGKTTTSNKVSVGGDKSKTGLGNNCADSKSDCEKTASILGAAEMKESHSFSQGGSPVSKSTFDKAVQNTPSFVIDQPIETVQKCVKTQDNVLTRYSHETCYVEHAKSAAETRWCNENSNDPSCKEPSAIKSETTEYAASASGPLGPLLNKAKKAGEKLGVELQDKVGVRRQQDYFPDKQSYTEKVTEHLGDAYEGKPGMSEVGEEHFRSETVTVFGDVGVKGKGKTGNKEIRITPIEIKGESSSVSTVESASAAALNEYEQAQYYDRMWFFADEVAPPGFFPTKEGHRKRIEGLKKRNSELDEQKRREAQAEQLRSQQSQRAGQDADQQQQLMQTLTQGLQMLGTAAQSYSSGSGKAAPQTPSVAPRYDCRSCCGGGLPK